MGARGRGRPPNLDRRGQAAELRAQGLTLAEIGRRLAVSRQYVWFMLQPTPPEGRPTDLRCGRCRRAIPGSAAAGRSTGAVYCAECLDRLPQATFAQRLQALRVARGLTRAALERLAGVPPSWVIRYERGQCLPRPRILDRLACVLGPGLHVHVPKRE
jgi:transcriptional regulator with XRE-family HTH domain